MQLWRTAVSPVFASRVSLKKVSMSRIAYIKHTLPTVARRHGSLSRDKAYGLLQQHLRSVRGEGRAHGGEATGTWRGSSARSPRCAWRMPMSAAALGVVMRETIHPEPGRERHRLPADHTWRRAARPCLSAGGDGAALVVTARFARRHHNRRWRSGRRRGDRAGQPLEPGRRQDPWRCCPTCSRSRPAREQGDHEAWFVGRDGKVTEGSSGNAWIVTARRQGRHPRGRSQRSCAASPGTC